MSEKKQLNEQDLDKVTGGFHEESDPKVGTEIELKYYRTNLNWSTGTKKAQVLKCGYLDKLWPGQKMYLLDIDNGWYKGWYSSGYIDSDYIFWGKDDIKNSCLAAEGDIESVDRELEPWEYFLG